MTDELKPCLAYPCGGIMEANIYDASLTCSRCQFQVADELEYNALVAGRQAAIDDEKQNPWKAAIIDKLIVDCIYSKEHESDPRRALAEAIEWNVKVALDPSASKEARDMQQAAIDAALENVRAWLEFKQDWYASREGMKYPENKTDAETAYSDAEYHVSTLISTNPLAEAQAKIKELNELYLYHEGLEKELQAKIAELERELSAQADTIVDGLAKRRELERERDRAIQHHERCAEKLFKAERELAEARKDAERYRWVRKHAYAVLSADGVDLHTGYQRKLHGTKSPKLWEEDNELDEAIDAAMRQEGE